MRNSVKSTRRVTAITLAAALAAAVYLNWQYASTVPPLESGPEMLAVAAPAPESGSDAEPGTGSGGILDALPTENEALASANKTYGEAQLVSVSKDSGKQFFEQERYNRTRARDEAMDTLQKSLKGTSLTPEEKAACTEQLTARLNSITAENEMEALIRAKGFADCLCFLGEGRADITVMTSGDALNAAQVAQIRDIVMSKSDVTAQNITIVEVK